MTTQDPTFANEPPEPPPKSKREQVLIACKKCRSRKTKCSGERPRCRQCELRHQPCEWEAQNDEGVRTTKRRLRDLEQRSAGEHELLNHLRNLSEADCKRLTAGLRGGSKIDDLLISARESSNVSAVESMLAANRQSSALERQDVTMLGPGLDCKSDHMPGEVNSSTHHSLPSIGSIWHPSRHPAGSTGPSTAPRSALPLSNASEVGKCAPIGQPSSSANLYDMWVNQS